MVYLEDTCRRIDEANGLNHEERWPAFVNHRHNLSLPSADRTLGLLTPEERQWLANPPSGMLIGSLLGEEPFIQYSDDQTYNQIAGRKIGPDRIGQAWEILGEYYTEEWA